MYKCKNRGEYFQSFIDNGIAPCLSILAVKNNQVICDFTGGSVKNGSNERVIDNKTRFNIGSVTKPVTASLVLKLVEFGEICLNDAVQKFIPEYLFKDVSIYHLLTHSAGYDESINIQRPKEKNDKLSYLKQIYLIDALKYTPGEVSTYFTQGYSILMDIIERITSTTLEEFAREFLFNPLGMSDTTYEITSMEEDQFVLPYNNSEKRYETEISKTPATADSGLYTNTRDLIKFSQMLLNGGVYNDKRIFSKSCVDLMLGEGIDNKFMKTPIFWMKGSSDIYGCFSDLCSGLTVGHPGYSGCMLFIDSVNKTTAVILSNSMELHSDWKNYKKIGNLIMSNQ